jgi:Serine carboxypeptidase S28
LIDSFTKDVVVCEATMNIHPPDAAVTATRTYGSISVSNYHYESSSEDVNEESPSSSSSHQRPLPSATRRRRGVLVATEKPLVPAFCLFVAFGVLLFFGHYNNNSNTNNGASSSLVSTKDRLGSMLMLQSPSSHSDRSSTSSDKKKIIPSGDTPRFYNEQYVDHFSRDKHPRKWTQRYYAQKKYWQGPGHPIFLMVGGEGGLDKGMFSPFVDRVMAETLGAYVLHPEHRFYGISQPVPNATNAQLVKLLTVEQAMADMIAIANHYRYEKLGCSRHKSSKHYCPLISVGGSYPAFMAMLMRITGEVDIAYASSAPVKLYEGHSDLANAYYEALTAASERASPGCADAVRSNLEAAIALMRNGPPEQDVNLASWATNKLNICQDSIPHYITQNVDPPAILAREVVQLIAMSFADANMIGNYPPTDDSRWAVQLCQVFQNATSPTEALVEFWKNLEIQDKSSDCFNMQVQLSEGRHATLSGADWSGLGPGLDGTMWDFQCCLDLLPALSFSEVSMFPDRQWSYEWVTEHCRNRFGTVGQLGRLRDKYHFDDLVGIGATRILFVNGGNDLWLPGSYLYNLSDSIVAVNMPNGAHHSELYAVPPRVQATADVQHAQHDIAALLTQWLDDIRAGRH